MQSGRNQHPPVGRSLKKQKLHPHGHFLWCRRSCGLNRACHFVLAANLRTANDTIKRVTPEMMMLKPTRVPITHSVLFGQ